MCPSQLTILTLMNAHTGKTASPALIETARLTLAFSQLLMMIANDRLFQGLSIFQNEVTDDRDLELKRSVNVRGIVKCPLRTERYSRRRSRCGGRGFDDVCCVASADASHVKRSPPHHRNVTSTAKTSDSSRYHLELIFVRTYVHVL